MSGRPARQAVRDSANDRGLTDHSDLCRIDADIVEQGRDLATDEVWLDGTDARHCAGVLCSQRCDHCAGVGAESTDRLDIGEKASRPRRKGRPRPRSARWESLARSFGSLQRESEH
jgi:hypothetical protein